MYDVNMRIRDLFVADDEEQRARVDGPSILEVVRRQEEDIWHGEDTNPNTNLPDEFDPGFFCHLPGDGDHPGKAAFNPYLFVPPSELEYLLKYKKDLSAESRKRIVDALALMG